MASEPVDQGEKADSPGSVLGNGLKVRHITMMGLGSAIGAGLFLGSGQGIKEAGPAVLLSYVIAGIIVIFVMRMLGEMGSAIPSSGSFAEYARMGIGNWAGFTMGWIYWAMLIMVLGAEITGASQIVQGWLPGVPQWVIALVFVTFFAVVNLSKVANFGEFEFWFAAIKVTVIVAFIILGVLLVFGLLPGTDPVGLVHLRGDGDGFMPNGIGGVAAGLLVVAFAFGGIEIVTIAAAESAEPERGIVIAVRNVIWRIGIFYVGSVAIMVLALPWTSSVLHESPFVAVLDEAAIPLASGFMELVVVIALLSAFNANIYGSTRMAFALAKRGDGPRALTQVAPNGTPRTAVLVSVFFAFVAVLLNWLLPDELLSLLLNAVGSVLLVVWIFVCVSQLRLRPILVAENKLKLKMWLFPYLTWATLAGLGGLIALMLTNETARNQLISTFVLFLIIIALSQVNARWRRNHHHPDSAYADNGKSSRP
ncbi:amino acid permease [Tomitella biformata]|uniref:amino acid permease n=1 Tax=Tomitella biformata TaxID=630403 RepID=UPI0004660899|nr:amino acid permease [Tomitella biformata]